MCRPWGILPHALLYLLGQCSLYRSDVIRQNCPEVQPPPPPPGHCFSRCQPALMHALAIHFLLMTTAPIPQDRKLRQRLGFCLWSNHLGMGGESVQPEALALTYSWVMCHGQS